MGCNFSCFEPEPRRNLRRQLRQFRRDLQPFKFVEPPPRQIKKDRRRYKKLKDFINISKISLKCREKLVADLNESCQICLNLEKIIHPKESLEHDVQHREGNQDGRASPLITSSVASLNSVPNMETKHNQIKNNPVEAMEDNVYNRSTERGKATTVCQNIQRNTTIPSSTMSAKSNIDLDTRIHSTDESDIHTHEINRRPNDISNMRIVSVTTTAINNPESGIQHDDPVVKSRRSYNEYTDEFSSQYVQTMKASDVTNLPIEDNMYVMKSIVSMDLPMPIALSQAGHGIELPLHLLTELQKEQNDRYENKRKENTNAARSSFMNSQLYSSSQEISSNRDQFEEGSRSMQGTHYTAIYQKGQNYYIENEKTSTTATYKDRHHDIDENKREDARLLFMSSQLYSSSQEISSHGNQFEKEGSRLTHYQNYYNENEKISASSVDDKYHHEPQSFEDTPMKVEEPINEEPLQILDVHQYFSDDLDWNSLDSLDSESRIKKIHDFAKTFEVKVNEFTEEKYSLEYFVLDEKLMQLIEKLDKIKCEEDRVLNKKLQVIQYIKSLHSILDERAKDEA